MTNHSAGLFTLLHWLISNLYLNATAVSSSHEPKQPLLRHPSNIKILDPPSVHTLTSDTKHTISSPSNTKSTICAYPILPHSTNPQIPTNKSTQLTAGPTAKKDARPGDLRARGFQISHEQRHHHARPEKVDGRIRVEEDAFVIDMYC